MATARHLRQLIESGTSGDLNTFRKVADDIINEERLKNHHLLANDLEKVLYGKSKDISEKPKWKIAAPVDREKGLPLLTIIEPARSLDDIVLSETNRSLISEIINEHNHTGRLGSYGMRPIDKVLLYGPPGTGKTLTAEVLAFELNRKLAILKIDSVISSFLGETSANLRSIFEFVEANNLVAFFDEFDAIGRERSDKSEHGEIKRVVNAFLQIMDNYKGNSIIIAATNHESELDQAVWRRFEEVLHYELPSDDQIIQLLKLKLRGIRFDDNPLGNTFAHKFKGYSQADIERVIRRAIKIMILEGKTHLGLKHFEQAFQREESRRNGMQS